MGDGPIIQAGIPRVNIPPANVPAPADAAQQHEAKKAQATPPPTSPKQDSYEKANPSTVFEPSRPAVGPADAGRLSAKVEHEKLPQPLKEKITPELWRGLGDTQRKNLVNMYSRMEAHGIWGHVTKVTGTTEKPAQIGGAKIAGPTGSIGFEIKDPDKLIADLKRSKHFGVDNVVMNLFHRKSKSLREAGAETGSMHISVGPGKKFEAHIDEISSVRTPFQGHGVPDPRGSVQHIGRELIPSFTKGVTIDANLVENRSGKHGAELKVGVGYEVRWGGVEKEKPNLRETPALDPAAKRVIEKLSGGPDFPLPKGLGVEDISREAVAEHVVQQLRKAASTGQTLVRVELPAYDNPQDRQKALGIVQEMSKLARRELAAEHQQIRPDKRQQAGDPGRVVNIAVAFDGNQKAAVLPIAK